MSEEKKTQTDVAACEHDGEFRWLVSTEQYVCQKCGAGMPKEIRAMEPKEIARLGTVSVVDECQHLGTVQYMPMTYSYVCGRCGVSPKVFTPDMLEFPYAAEAPQGIVLTTSWTLTADDLGEILGPVDEPEEDCPSPCDDCDKTDCSPEQTECPGRIPTNCEGMVWDKEGKDCGSLPELVHGYADVLKTSTGDSSFFSKVERSPEGKPFTRESFLAAVGEMEGADKKNWQARKLFEWRHWVSTLFLDGPDGTVKTEALGICMNGSESEVRNLAQGYIQELANSSNVIRGCERMLGLPSGASLTNSVHRLLVSHGNRKRMAAIGKAAVIALSEDETDDCNLEHATPEDVAEQIRVIRGNYHRSHEFDMVHSLLVEHIGDDVSFCAVRTLVNELIVDRDNEDAIAIELRDENKLLAAKVAQADSDRDVLRQLNVLLSGGGYPMSTQDLPGVVRGLFNRSQAFARVRLLLDAASEGTVSHAAVYAHVKELLGYRAKARAELAEIFDLLNPLNIMVQAEGRNGRPLMAGDEVYGVETIVETNSALADANKGLLTKFEQSDNLVVGLQSILRKIKAEAGETGAHSLIPAKVKEMREELTELREHNERLTDRNDEWADERNELESSIDTWRRWAAGGLSTDGQPDTELRLEKDKELRTDGPGRVLDSICKFLDANYTRQKGGPVRRGNVLAIVEGMHATAKGLREENTNLHAKVKSLGNGIMTSEARTVLDGIVTLMAENGFRHDSDGHEPAPLSIEEIIPALTGYFAAADRNEIATEALLKDLEGTKQKLRDGRQNEEHLGLVNMEHRRELSNWSNGIRAVLIAGGMLPAGIDASLGDVMQTLGHLVCAMDEEHMPIVDNGEEGGA